MPQSYKPLEAPKRLLFGPGPSMVAPRVYQAMGQPAARARVYALHAFSAYLGIQHILKYTPRYFGKEGRADYVRHLNETLGSAISPD